MPQSCDSQYCSIVIAPTPLPGRPSESWIVAYRRLVSEQDAETERDLSLIRDDPKVLPMRLGTSPSGGWDVRDLAIHSEQTNSIADAALEGAGTTSLVLKRGPWKIVTRGDEAHLKLNYRRALAREGYCVVDADASLYRADQFVQNVH